MVPLMLRRTPPSTKCLFFFFFFLFGSASCTDYAALTAFKSGLILEADSLLSTNWTSNTQYCTWFGVTCSNGRVTRLDLTGLALQGELSPQISNLTHLSVLNLSRNELEGALPSELGSLQQLTILNLTRNSLQGSIPANLSGCRRLEQLDLSFNFIAGTLPHELSLLQSLGYLALQYNNLTGNIPASFGNFSNLEVLFLAENDLDGVIPSELGKLSLLHLNMGGNNLTGSIPPSIFNISTMANLVLSVNKLSGELPDSLGSQLPRLYNLDLHSNRITGKLPRFLPNASQLEILYLDDNDLHGEIPADFGRFVNLQWLLIELNRISGSIPPGVFNITSLQSLNTRHNYLSGDLPHDIGNWLPNIQDLILSHNQFTGQIPSSICNATKLVHVQVSNNSFSGPVPMMLGNLVDLEMFSIQANLLTINPDSMRLEFLNSLVNCQNLQYLLIAGNPLNGIIPESVSNLSSSLQSFIGSSCQLKDGIPPGFGNLSSLNYFGVNGNNLQGTVPLSFSRLQNLELLDVANNQLEGSIPTHLCSIRIMGYLRLGGNNFSGSIPTCFQNLTQLRSISLAANKLNSTVPLEFWTMENVQVVDLSRNLLYGSIPAEVGNIKAITAIDLSYNNFSGEIPNSIGSLQNILRLDMSRNNFQGPIPNSLSNLIVIQSLDLSSNVLSGDIPASLASLRDLRYLNLSFNRLRGEIPHGGVFGNLTYQSLMGNPSLCGGFNLNLPLCPPPQASGKRKRINTSRILQITVPIAATILLLFTIILVWIKFSRGKAKRATGVATSSPVVGHQIVTYHELVRATESFSISNSVGEGSSGMVYKGELSNGTVAAIKVFNMQYAKALKNFDMECAVLSKVRHRNLVKVISTCSNLEFKAMVLEFMSNGSLDMRVHSESSSLSLVERLNIVTDVALGMEYLHHEYTVPILHCDLKPANILLDEDMTAHVADFGISKILAQDQEFIQTITLGTIGYIAPEYGQDGYASTKGDVYSFGILLLETFTGRRPTDDMFNEDLSLHKWVQKAFPDALEEVLDSSLFPDTSSFTEYMITAAANKKQNCIKEILVPIIDVAFLCLKELPEDRIDMRSAVAKLKKIRA